MRGLENVRAEFSLTALAYNLRRAINILGVGTLIAAIQGSRPPVLSVTPTRGA
jgi:transposase